MATENKRRRRDPSEENDMESQGPLFKRGRLYSPDASIGDKTRPHEAAKKAHTRLEYFSELDIGREPQKMCVRNTGIICRIGKH